MGMGQTWQDSQGMTSGKGPLTEQPRKVSLCRIEGASQDMTAKPGPQCRESRGQDCWGRTIGTGQLGQDSRDVIARIGQPEKIVGIVHPGQEAEDITARTGHKTAMTGQGDWTPWCVSRHRTCGTGPLKQDSRDRSSWMGEPGQDRENRTART
jgi:hypothetical protein